MTGREQDGDGASAALGEALRRAIGRFVRVVRTDARTPHSARSEALALLEREGAMNIAGLAQLRDVKHQTMRSIVARLEADGLVLCAPDPGDRRSRTVSMTAAGRDALAHERRMRASRIDSLLKSHVSGEEQAVLARAITILDRISTASER